MGGALSWANLCVFSATVSWWARECGCGSGRDGPTDTDTCGLLAEPGAQHRHAPCAVHGGGDGCQPLTGGPEPHEHGPVSAEGGFRADVKASHSPIPVNRSLSGKLRSPKLHRRHWLYCIVLYCSFFYPPRWLLDSEKLKTSEQRTPKTIAVLYGKSSSLVFFSRTKLTH